MSTTIIPTTEVQASRDDSALAIASAATPAVDLASAQAAAAAAERHAAEAAAALARAQAEADRQRQAAETERARRKRVWATGVLKTLKTDLETATKERAAATANFQTAVREGGNILLAFHRVTETHARVWSLHMAGAKATNYVPQLGKLDLQRLGLTSRTEPVFIAPDFAMTLAEALRLVAGKAETAAAASAVAGLRALDEGGEA